MQPLKNTMQPKRCTLRKKNIFPAGPKLWNEKHCQTYGTSLIEFTSELKFSFFPKNSKALLEIKSPVNKEVSLSLQPRKVYTIFI